MPLCTQVGALYTAFCAMMLSAGVPPVLAVMSLAYNVNLFGSITHYASGQAAVYCGSGFMKIDEVGRVHASPCPTVHASMSPCPCVPMGLVVVVVDR